MDGGDARGEEEGGDDGAVGVMQNEEKAEKFVPDRETGAEDRGGGAWVRMWAGRERREDVRHV